MMENTLASVSIGCTDTDGIIHNDKPNIDNVQLRN
jgi:hypothetical protein